MSYNTTTTPNVSNVGYTITLRDEKDGSLEIYVTGVKHDRKNMLKVAAQLRRAAALIEVSDAK